MSNESSVLLTLPQSEDAGFPEDTSLEFTYSFTKRIPLVGELESNSLGGAGI